MRVARSRAWQVFGAVLGGALLAAPSTPTLAAPTATVWGATTWGRSLDWSRQAMRRATTYLSPSQHARSTLPGGRWGGKSRNDWTSGFFAGCQWLLYGLTADAGWAQRARLQTADLEALKTVNQGHDLGFQMMCSFGQGWRRTGDPAYLAVLHTAADTLSQRYDADVGALKSWDWRTPSGYQWQFPVIVDSLMNLELLFFAARHGGDPAWHDQAWQHALTVRREHVRRDASTWHVVDFDENNGAVLWKGTYQGAADRSTWARGQAWGIYGFTMAWRYTGDERLLRTARSLALEFLTRLPADSVPYWDFDAPGIPNEPRDSSAAAIAASGLLELATSPIAPAEARYFGAGANRLMEALEQNYLGAGSGTDGILLHATGNRPAGAEVDVSLIYGDYYFLEALERLRPGRVVR